MTISIESLNSLNVLQKSYLNFVTEFHKVNPCQTKVNNHLERIKSPFTVLGNSFDVADFFQIINDIGGFSKIKGFSRIAIALGFDPQRSTNITHRFKKWIQDHHIREFYEFEHANGSFEDFIKNKSAYLSSDEEYSVDENDENDEMIESNENEPNFKLIQQLEYERKIHQQYIEIDSQRKEINDCHRKIDFLMGEVQKRDVFIDSLVIKNKNIPNEMINK